MINLTPSAQDKIRALRQQQNNPQLNLRIMISGGGCSGFQYNIDLDDQIKQDDQVFAFGDVSVVIDTTSLEFLKDSEIDYVEDLMAASFRINNPNAVSGCGCGSSFSVI